MYLYLTDFELFCTYSLNVLNTMIAKFEIHALLIQNRNEERREKERASPSKLFLGAGKGEMPVWIFNMGRHCGYVHARVCVCMCGRDTR